jgi:hypothetical protein
MTTAAAMLEQQHSRLFLSIMAKFEMAKSIHLQIRNCLAS